MTRDCGNDEVSFLQYMSSASSVGAGAETEAANNITSISCVLDRVAVLLIHRSDDAIGTQRPNLRSQCLL